MTLGRLNLQISNDIKGETIHTCRPSNASLTLTHNDEQAKPRPYFIGANIIGEIKSTPPQAVVRAETAGTPFTTELHLASRSGKPFKITSIEADIRKDMNVVLDPKPNSEGTSYTLTITGVTPTDKNMATGNIVLTTDTNGGETMKIPFYVMVMKNMPQVGGMPVAGQGTKTTQPKSSAAPTTPASGPAHTSANH